MTDRFATMPPGELDAPDLAQADVPGFVSGKLPAPAAAMRRGFTRPNDGQFATTYPASGQLGMPWTDPLDPPDAPEGFQR